MSKLDYIKASIDIVKLGFKSCVYLNKFDKDFFINIEFDSNEKANLYNKLEENSELNYILKLNRRSLVDIADNPDFKLIFNSEPLIDFNKQIMLQHFRSLLRNSLFNQKKYYDYEILKNINKILMFKHEEFLISYNEFMTVKSVSRDFNGKLDFNRKNIIQDLNSQHASV